jgi:hypothetical protein
VTVPVPPRAAAERAAAETEPLHTATAALVGSLLGSLTDALRRNLTASYERLAAAEAQAQQWREHAEADHAALERVGGQLRAWNRVMGETGRVMDPATRETLAHVCHLIQVAIDGNEEGSHGQGTAQGDTGTGRA